MSTPPKSDQALDEIRSLARFPDENPNPVIRLSRQGEVLYANGPSAPLLKSWATSVGQIVGDSLQSEIEKALRSDGSHYFEYVCEDTIFAIDLAPIDGADYLNAYCRDITKRRAAETRVENLAKFPDENPNPVMRVTAAGEIAYSNSPCAPMLETWGTSPGGRVPKDILSLLTTALEDNRSVEVEVVTAVTIYGLQIAPVPSSEYANFYARDIAAQKHAEQSLIEARDVAVEASKSKSEFLANMSHELRTPMNAIIGYSEMLIEEAEEEAKEEAKITLIEDLRKIHSAGGHLLQLINDILDLSKIEAGQMAMYLEEIDFSEFLDEVRDTMRPLAEANSNTFSMTRPERVPAFHSDAMRVRQILFNLLSNAFKFTRQGEVTLHVEVEGTETLPSLVLKVIDTGIGMTEQQIQAVFEAFQQADASTTREYGGTGLGLTITKRLVKMLGGSIDVSSIPGEGTTFRVCIPMQQPGDDTQEPQATRSPSTASNKRLVLVIDDDAVVRDILESTLTKAGFGVVCASSGREGLRLARELQPIAITLDVLMPEMDGWSVLSALKSAQETENIPVVIVTIIDDKQLGFTLGAAEFMTKPIDRNKLIRVIRQLHAAEHPGTLLIVEDDQDARDLLRKSVEKLGWKSVEAEDGRSALAKLDKHKPDMIILDLMLPEMNGFQFLEEIRMIEEWRSIPVIVVTARELSTDERKYLCENVKTILRKGQTSGDAILESICEVLSDSIGSASGSSSGPAPGGVAAARSGALP